MASSQPELSRTVRKVPNLLRRRHVFLGGTIALIVAAGVLLSPFLVGWGLVFHSTCENETLVSHATDARVPDVLVNSPFGGNASGAGLMPGDFPGAWNGPPPSDNFRFGWGARSSNGTSFGAFFEVNLSFYRDGNVSVLGPGSNAPCVDSFQVEFNSPYQYGNFGAQITKLSNLSDENEANYATFPEGPNLTIQSPAWFNNSFFAANSASISTCGGALVSTTVHASGLSIKLKFDVAGQTHWLPTVLPFWEQFTYQFPANFGTWQVDNLSASGGPGGGWAFSYSPCP